jgi:hypothetical protein
MPQWSWKNQIAFMLRPGYDLYRSLDQVTAEMTKHFFTGALG